jgi:hypothetical protein
MENLILDADIAGISTVLLLIEPEEEDNAVSASVTEDKSIVTMIKNLDNI